MMRIVTGSARGVRLATLEGEATRPTSERVKQAVFSSIQFNIEGRTVLDLFAGSGQMGLEALSRGAASAMFVDSSADAMDIVKQNIEKCRFGDRSRTLISDYRNYIRKAKGKYSFDLIFIDPPYASGAATDAVKRCIESGLAAPGCIFVCESSEASDAASVPEIAERVTFLKQAQYGRMTGVSIFLLDPEREEL